MKCEFYLVDANEEDLEGNPSVRFWGIDRNGKRVTILCNQIVPYFYYVIDEADGLEGLKEQILRDKERFPKILDVTIESKKLLGRDCKALKITCADLESKSAYGEHIRKAYGKGRSYEHDLRLSTRYITDFMLTPCGWNECEVDATKFQHASVDYSYVAIGLPRSARSETVPKLRVLAFNVLTAAEKSSSKPEKDPIRAIAIANSSGESETLVSEERDDRELLKDFVKSVNEFDPDIIVGFETNKQDWLYLTQRAKLQKFKMSVGRDSSGPHTSMYGHVSVTGRANIDLSDVIGGISEVKVKTLENVVQYLQLSSAGKFTTIEEWDRYQLWANGSARKKLVKNSESMAQASLELAEATENFPMQLSTLTGLMLDQVMAAAVGFRVDSYFVREAHRIGELIPTRNEQPYFTYRGAMVLEPKSGLHENVAVLDFASMYPALMKKYNLSPDSLLKPIDTIPDDEAYIIPEVKHRFRKKPDGFYKTVLTKLIDERNEIKERLKEANATSTKNKVLMERERALKVITNACYGYAGWAGARWYAREVAESATALGRETITKTIERARALGLDIIYGDTDSIFVKNERPKVDRLLSWVKKELDLDIRIEKEYVRVMFTEAMKRYAGLLPDGSLDIVGLEVVRGDWSELARDVQENVLEKILVEQSPEKAVETVRGTIRRLQKGEVPLSDLAIRKTLTKPIEKYTVRVPHVEVARLLMKEGWALDVGDKVAYLITKGQGPLFKKAKPYNRVKPEEIDVEYYLDNQVKPAAMRILERFGVNEKQLIV